MLESDGPCSVYDINNGNVVAGNCEEGAAGEFFPVRWAPSLPDGLPQRLNPLLGHVKAAAWTISHAGAVVGLVSMAVVAPRGDLASGANRGGWAFPSWACYRRC
jgi:hypothetical protein